MMAHRNVLEADLIRLVLLYSSESIQIESTVEEGDVRRRIAR